MCSCVISKVFLFNARQHASQFVSLRDINRNVQHGLPCYPRLPSSVISCRHVNPHYPRLLWLILLSYQALLSTVAISNLAIPDFLMSPVPLTGFVVRAGDETPGSLAFGRGPLLWLVLYQISSGSGSRSKRNQSNIQCRWKGKLFIWINSKSKRLYTQH